MNLSKQYLNISEGKVNEELPVKLKTAIEKLHSKPKNVQAELGIVLLDEIIAQLAASSNGMRELKEFANSAYEIVVRGGESNAQTSEKEKEFIEYFRSFYDPKNPDVLYPKMIKPGWSDQDILDGIKKRGKQFEGDSMDREAIRDMLIAKYGSDEE